MNEVAKGNANPGNMARSFRQTATTIAKSILVDWVGEDRAREATGRITAAISAAAQTAKKPEEFYACTPQSIGSVIAISALTGIMPSTGASALAYAIPRRARKGEPPQLTYQLSHRGINALAGRANRMMVALAVSYTDGIEVDDCGEVRVVSIDFDNPPVNEEELRGILLLVKDTSNGVVLTRQWVSKKVINERRKASDAYNYAAANEWAQKSDPWHRWYVEQAMKTAMHYAIGRGWCVIDDTESVRALSEDQRADTRDDASINQPARIVYDMNAETGAVESLLAKAEARNSAIDKVVAVPSEVVPAVESYQEFTLDPDFVDDSEIFPDEDSNVLESEDVPFALAASPTKEPPSVLFTGVKTDVGEWHTRMQKLIEKSTGTTILLDIQEEADRMLGEKILTAMRHKDLTDKIKAKVSSLE